MTRRNKMANHKHISDIQKIEMERQHKKTRRAQGHPKSSLEQEKYEKMVNKIVYLKHLPKLRESHLEEIKDKLSMLVEEQ